MRLLLLMTGLVAAPVAALDCSSPESWLCRPDATGPCDTDMSLSEISPDTAKSAAWLAKGARQSMFRQDRTSMGAGPVPTASEMSLFLRACRQRGPTPEIPQTRNIL